jgi:hypothetical protein
VGEALLQGALVSLHVALGLPHQLHLAPHRPRLLARALQHFFVQTQPLEDLLLRRVTSIFATNASPKITFLH